MPRAIARRDAAEAVLYYAEAVDGETAARFADCLEEAFRKIADAPKLGSPALGQLLDLPGLRVRKLGRFPYVVLYIERADRIDVIRILHSARDIGALLPDDDEDLSDPG